MGLRNIVKVGDISNLSDARYCAGMGVDILGFCLEEGYPGYIGTSKITEIVNWVSGIKVAGEFSTGDLEYMNRQATQLRLDYFELNLSLLDIHQIQNAVRPLILKGTYEEWNTITGKKILTNEYTNIAFCILKSHTITSELLELIDFYKDTQALLIDSNISASEINMLSEKVFPAGFNLKGGHELRPGLKDYSELNEILELLEEDN